MSNRRNFLKNSLIGASIFTIPKFSFGQVSNWENMDSISTSSEDDEKRLINAFENLFKNAKIGEEYMENLFIDPSYYEENYNCTKLWWDKYPNYVYLDFNTHKLLTCKDIDYLNFTCDKYLFVPGFIFAARMNNNSIKSLSDGYYFIINEIIKEMKFVWKECKTSYYSPLDAKLVIMQKFGKYNVRYYKEENFKEDGIQPMSESLIPNQNSNILAMRVGMCIFNSEKNSNIPSHRLNEWVFNGQKMAV